MLQDRTQGTLQSSGDGYYIHNSFRERYGVSRRCTPGRSARAASLLLVLIALCGACSKSETATEKPATEKPATEESTASPAADDKLLDLSIGKEAPDIEGDDIDGESFKLSDYRGKVVLLDFWGHW